MVRACNSMTEAWAASYVIGLPLLVMTKFGDVVELSWACRAAMRTSTRMGR